MKNFCALIGKYFGLLAVAFLVLGFMDPGLFRWVLGKVGSVSVLSLLLGVVMFGMGTPCPLRILFSSSSGQKTSSWALWRSFLLCLSLPICSPAPLT